MTAIDETDLAVRKISIIHGYVQVGRALNWPAAREALARSVYDVFGPRVTGIGRVGAAAAARRLLRRAASAPVEETSAGSRWIWIADPGHGVWCAQEGDHGLQAGSLAIVHDAHEPGAYEWTVDVKCRITEVDGRHALVKITGNSVQFERGQLVRVGTDQVRPRT